MGIVTYNVNKAAHLRRIALTHKQKVLSLYKQALHVIRFSCDDFFEAKEKALELRQRFEAAKDVKDYRVAKQMLEKGQEELRLAREIEDFNYTFSVGGTGYQQEPSRNDVLLDYWHPLEKAMYPYYFARREQRKQEYIKLFESDYGNAEKLLGIEKKYDYSEIVDELEAKMKEINAKKD
ncbi:NADH dehydrogenase [ubiquinone] 1 beta subcomplex subunit 9 [Tetranychus urticae]|uniref:NADH dehydrogenase [ubiquinone] 1 beta subcomplex subunit 9 n=1 Tax=Tetranychus urticae TaxID=32264 RepID=T1KK85_TETUR|nr:NADH dehydrogenase [ubiquinone] 1 beta subcomplex subunit 9 [Tetranychus urticae]